jgi:hypothetical protein
VRDFVIGHNNPPSETEILKQRLDDYRDEKEMLDRLSKREIPAEITDDEQAGKLSDHIAAAKILFSKISDIHKKEKAPFWDAGKAADAWKNDYEAKINALISKASTPLFVWNKKKEAEERQRQLEIARKAREDAAKLEEEAVAHANEGIIDTANDLMDAAIQEETKADLIQDSAYQVKGKSSGGFSSSTIKREWTPEIESMAALDLDAIRKYFKEEEILPVLKRAVKDGVREIRGVRIYEAEQLSTRRK